MTSHFKQLESTIEESESIGRKLDFLMQEMHREINTIGSKNQNSEISLAVVQSKTILEKCVNKYKILNNKSITL